MAPRCCGRWPLPSPELRSHEVERASLAGRAPREHLVVVIHRSAETARRPATSNVTWREISAEITHETFPVAAAQRRSVGDFSRGCMGECARAELRRSRSGETPRSGHVGAGTAHFSVRYVR